MDDGTLGVYVHVPFCERICPYCDFAVVRTRRLASELEGAYVDALLRELESRWEAFAGRRLESVYLGGGTPSLLDPASVKRITNAVCIAFPGWPPREVTLEVNPSTLERERLPAFRAAGVDRISLGIQSLDDTVLRRLGRAHRADEGREALRACGVAGFENRSVDLIFGVPSQTPESFRRDLGELIQAEVPHVSLYQLSVEADTPYAGAIARGILALPTEDEALQMLDCGERGLEAAGLRRYELSSYARPGFESVHNRRYWQRRPVLGLGMGAWSCEPPRTDAPFGARRANVRNLGVYLERMAAGASTAAGPPERLDAHTARGEAIFLALRTQEGLSAPSFDREFGAPPRTFYADSIERLEQAGLLSEQPDGSLCLTPRGRLLADSVFEHFV